MTEPFKLKTDLSKVSRAVQQFVANIAKTEGNKKKIDTDYEFNQLSMYLSGAGMGMNKDEIGYVQGLMFEYQSKKADEFEKNSVTDNTKKEVSKIAKRMGDKKLIDTDEEAQALATMLRNTHNDLNQADILYIENLLINSGYANYLPKPEQDPIQVVNVTLNEIYIQDNKNKNNFGEETPVQTDEKVTKPVPKSRIPRNPSVNPNKPTVPVKPESKPKTEEPEDKKEKPTISEQDRNSGFGLADRIVHELNSHIADNKVIKDALNNVNKKNAYSFIGKFVSQAKQGVNEAVFSVSDLFNKLSYEDTLKVMVALINQAESIGLRDTAAFKALADEIQYANRYLDENPKADPSKVTIKKADKAVQDLYKEMSKLYE